MDDQKPMSPLDQLAKAYENEDSQTEEVDIEPDPSTTNSTRQKRTGTMVKKDTEDDEEDTMEDTVVETDDTYIDEIEQHGRHRNLWSHTTTHDKKTITGTSADFFNLIDRLHSQIQEKDAQLQMLAQNVQKTQKHNAVLRNDIKMNQMKSLESDLIVDWLKRELSGKVNTAMDGDEKVSESDGSYKNRSSSVVNVDDDIKVEQLVAINVEGLAKWKSDLENLVRSCKMKYEAQKAENKELLMRLEDMRKQLEKKNILTSMSDVEEVRVNEETDDGIEDVVEDENTVLLKTRDVERKNEYRIHNARIDDETTSCCMFW